MKQTAVEWLVNQISYTTSEGDIISHHKNITDLVKEAKEMQKIEKLKRQLFIPAVFLSGKDKVEQFQKELKTLLAKYDAELTIEDFGRNWSSDEKIVVNFSWDEDLANRTNDGNVPDWVVGRWENGR